jgi:hypothetical protein
MNSVNRLLLLSGLAAIALPRALLADGEIPVDVVVNMTAAGEAVARPDATHPAYYYPVTRGYTEGGDFLEGEALPPATWQVQHMVAVALHQEGYVYCGRAHRPSILLMLWWGYKAPVIIDNNDYVNTPSIGGHQASGSASGAGGPFPYDPINQAFRTGNMLTSAVINKTEMEELVLGSDYETETYRNLPSLRLEKLVNASRVPRYYIMLSALDFDAATRKETVVLWTARISTARQDHTLAEVLPTLIAEGVPMAGRRTEGPQWLDSPIVPMGRVLAGTPVMKPGAPPAQ